MKAPSSMAAGGESAIKSLDVASKLRHRKKVVDIKTTIEAIEAT